MLLNVPSNDVVICQSATAVWPESMFPRSAVSEGVTG